MRKFFVMLLAVSWMVMSCVFIHENQEKGGNRDKEEEIDNSEGLADIMPDKHFRGLIIKGKPATETLKGQELLDELKKITKIDANFSAETAVADIEDTTGVEYLTELEDLNLLYNKFETIDVSQNTKLEILDLDRGTEFDNPNLNIVYVNQTQMITYDDTKWKIGRGRLQEK